MGTGTDFWTFDRKHATSWAKAAKMSMCHARHQMRVWERRLDKCEIGAMILVISQLGGKDKKGNLSSNYHGSLGGSFRHSLG